MGMIHDFTKWTGVVAKLSPLIWEVCASDPCRNTGYLEVLHGFPQPLQANVMVAPRLQYNCFLLNPFPYITHLTSYHSTL
jgi:hypothetical protein